ncbi:hypothetical protein NECAME_09348 [Necator americanus]|uniref:Uncharacterized protein n=1 Tax=Necator americanus TaxID=51031 RepID=W2TE79_NECAM|nr:hypothetical protein NECAME_09348 [Necator americanus]ETN80148.1 hypothetical protein NECAME_09348 [Necator americanus]
MYYGRAKIYNENDNASKKLPEKRCGAVTREISRQRLSQSAETCEQFFDDVILECAQLIGDRERL